MSLRYSFHIKHPWPKLNVFSIQKKINDSCNFHINVKICLIWIRYENIYHRSLNFKVYPDFNELWSYVDLNFYETKQQNVARDLFFLFKHCPFGWYLYALVLEKGVDTLNYISSFTYIRKKKLHM